MSWNFVLGGDKGTITAYFSRVYVAVEY